MISLHRTFRSSALQLLGAMIFAVLVSSAGRAATAVKVPGAQPINNPAVPAPIRMGVVQEWVFVPLPAGTEPLASSESGHVVLLRSDPWGYVRWESGVEFKLRPDRDIGSYSELARFSQRELKTTDYSVSKPGSIALGYQLLDGGFSTPGKVEEFILVWAPGSFFPRPVLGDWMPIDPGNFNDIGQRLFSSRRPGKLITLDGANYVWGNFAYKLNVSAPWKEYPFRVNPVSEFVNATTLVSPELQVMAVSRGASHSVGVKFVEVVGGDGVLVRQPVNGTLDNAPLSFLPLYVNDNGVVLGAPNLSDWQNPNVAATLVYSVQTGVRPLPAGGRVTWIDEQDRLHGFDAATGGNPVMWVVKTAADGSPLPQLSYEQVPYVPLPNPGDWVTNHRIPPGTKMPQLGMMTRPLTGQRRPFLAVRGGVPVDSNRDGQIVVGGSPTADAISPTAPYFLPINNHTEEIGGFPQGLDQQVNGANDLKNFHPVFLDIKALVRALPPSARIKYRLKQADNALNFVPTDLTAATAFSFRQDTRPTGYGSVLLQPVFSARTYPISSAGSDLFEPSVAGVQFVDRILNHEGGVILIEARGPTDQPLVLSVELADSMLGTVVLTEIKLPILTASLSLAVDANRDGFIKLASDDPSDATSANRPYRFWINDDDDSGDKDHIGSSDKDWEDSEINSVRDLEDFTRLRLYLGGLQDAVIQGQIQVGLKWKDTTGSPSLKLWRNLSPNGGTEYLTNPTVAQQHLALRSPGVVQGGTSYLIPTQYWQDVGLSASQPYGNFLFEGCTSGKGQLVITLNKADGTVIGEGPGVWLDLKNIKSMYERAVATTGGPRSENGVDYTIPLPYNYVGPDSTNIPQPTMGWEPNTLGYSYEPDPAETKAYFIYVHGWRWSPEKANNRTETVFKRLWHLGYKGRLTALRWPTFYGGPDDGDDWIAGLSTYNDSEYRAWKSGQSLKLYINQLPSGYTRNVVAHSMGNIVTGSALRQGMSVANYVLLNAAVPAMCYDESTTLYQPWVYTTPNDDPDNGTKALAYVGKLKTLNTNVVNFYLSRDSATTTAWEANNYQFKPQNQIITSCVRGYSYVRSHAPGTKLFVDFCVSPLRNLIDEHESMAFACQSLTKTVGAEGRTAGPITDSVDMDASYGFGDEHGAEWDRNYAQTKAFYQRLLITMGNSTP